MIGIESLDHEGRGVAHVEGKALFVEGALPGEIVDYSVFKKKPKVEFANVSKMFRESPFRVDPKCANFGVCGGCSMQHLDASAQVAVKQRVLEDALWHIGRVKPECILPAIHGPYWEYRHRARFSVKYVEKKGKVLVGFNEKKTRYVTDMDGCEVLPRRISMLIPHLKEMITSLSIRARLPQIEVASGEEADIMVFRILDPLTGNDEESIRAFSEEHRVNVFLQPKGIDSIRPFHPTEPGILHYSLPEYGIDMPFRPSDFTQVNFSINRVLVKRAITLLSPSKNDRIADLFCGIGNFTLALAKHCGEVVGVEGSLQLVERARENAERNGITNAKFIEADLFETKASRLDELGQFDKMLIDPPRAGAHALVESLGGHSPSRIVYVSCDPATLARDAGILVHSKGYRLKSAGVINMFPHTSHVESIALFELPQGTKPRA
ncbi:MAG TPA: 23S rRNA (uracil(1939)-C(5))-methyltransferase RlmD [Burkholderiales bacterium]|nr:23S rRNA (uracil(1939)-C(5))-methyltransferase RlmD [Burkholderiales bacterium]